MEKIYTEVTKVMGQQYANIQMAVVSRRTGINVQCFRRAFICVQVIHVKRFERDYDRTTGINRL